MGSSPSQPSGISEAEFNRHMDRYQKANEEMRKEMQKQYETLMAEKKQAEERAQRERAADRKEFQQRMDKMEERATKQRDEMYQKHQQQMEKQAADNRKNIESIMEKNSADQKAALKLHHEQSEKALKDQQDMFNKMEKERKEAAQKEMDMMKNTMEQKYEDQKKQMDEKIAALSEEQHEERERLLAQQAAEKELFDQKVQQLETNMAEREQQHKEKLDEMLKLVEKKNYESHYPMPESMRLHQEKNPFSFNIQILGCRGAGKSTFINRFMQKIKGKKFGKIANTGVNETTKLTAYYEITDIVESMPDRYGKVFICDQPGIGGLEITEAGYLNNFGPGHFNFTFMLGEKGFNELDMSLLKHLLFNNKPVAFIRTQCDSAISGLQDTFTQDQDDSDAELSFEDALMNLQERFGKYIKITVLQKVQLADMEIFYIGIPVKKFPDFDKLTRYIVSGELLKKIADNEANEQILNLRADQTADIQNGLKNSQLGDAVDGCIETAELDDAVARDALNQCQ